jgi:hypothetical protein
MPQSSELLLLPVAAFLGARIEEAVAVFGPHVDGVPPWHCQSEARFDF